MSGERPSASSMPSDAPPPPAKLSAMISSPRKARTIGGRLLSLIVEDVGIEPTDRVPLLRCGRPSPEPSKGGTLRLCDPGGDRRQRSARELLAHALGRLVGGC